MIWCSSELTVSSKNFQVFSLSAARIRVCTLSVALVSTPPTLPITQQTTYCHHKLNENEGDKGAEDVIHLILSKLPVWNACLELNRFVEKNR